MELSHPFVTGAEAGAPAGAEKAQTTASQASPSPSGTAPRAAPDALQLTGLAAQRSPNQLVLAAPYPFFNRLSRF